MHLYYAVWRCQHESYSSNAISVRNTLNAFPCPRQLRGPKAEVAPTHNTGNGFYKKMKNRKRQTNNTIKTVLCPTFPYAWQFQPHIKTTQFLKVPEPVLRAPTSHGHVYSIDKFNCWKWSSWGGDVTPANWLMRRLVLEDCFPAERFLKVVLDTVTIKGPTSSPKLQIP